jgi:hypothetical protein
VTSKSTSSELLPYSYAGWWLRPQASDRPALHWHIASRAFALTMWATPRPYRFKAAKALSRCLAPIVRRTSWYRSQSGLRIDGVREIALHHVLSIMNHSGALFDPKLCVDGAEQLDAALKSGRGVLFVAPHALLSLTLFRYLYDRHTVPMIVSLAPLVHVYGKRLVARAIQPSPSFMIRLRSVLRGGGVVSAMIDRQPAGQPGTVELETASGPVYISDALIRLAKRCNAHVIFTAVRVDKHRGVVLTFRSTEPAQRAEVCTITKEFAAFLQEHLTRVDSSLAGNGLR